MVGPLFDEGDVQAGIDHVSAKGCTVRAGSNDCDPFIDHPPIPIWFNPFKYRQGVCPLWQANGAIDNRAIETASWGKGLTETGPTGK